MAAALIGLGRRRTARCTSARCWATARTCCGRWPRPALGGYTLCGINNTRRGEGLRSDIRRAECQLLVTDAEHRPLLDGLDLAGVRVLDTSTDEWADLVAARGCR